MFLPVYCSKLSIWLSLSISLFVSNRLHLFFPFTGSHNCLSTDSRNGIDTVPAVVINVIFHVYNYSLCCNYTWISGPFTLQSTCAFYVLFNFNLIFRSFVNRTFFCSFDDSKSIIWCNKRIYLINTNSSCNKYFKNPFRGPI